MISSLRPSPKRASSGPRLFSRKNDKVDEGRNTNAQHQVDPGRFVKPSLTQSSGKSLTTLNFNTGQSDRSMSVKSIQSSPGSDLRRAGLLQRQAGTLRMDSVDQINVDSTEPVLTRRRNSLFSADKPRKAVLSALGGKKRQTSETTATTNPISRTNSTASSISGSSNDSLLEVKQQEESSCSSVASSLSAAQPSADDEDSIDSNDGLPHSMRLYIKNFLTSKRRVLLLTSKQREDIRLCIEEDFQEHYCHGTDVLASANYMLSEFKLLNPRIEKTSMAYSLQESILLILQDHLYPILSRQYLVGTKKQLADQDDTQEKSLRKDLTAEQAARFLSWIDSLINFLQPLDIPPIQAWSQDINMLVRHYLHFGVRREMLDTIQRALSLINADDVRLNDKQHMVTGLPGQIAFLYQQQLAVSKDLLPDTAFYQEAVLATCNQALQESLSELIILVSSQWGSLGSSRFCAIINDAYSISEQAEMRNEALTTKEHVDAGDALIRDLTEVSLHATSYLCERVMADLKDPVPILSSVGTPSWVVPDEVAPAIETTIATLQDYLEDFQHWLISDYYFPKLIKNCLDLTLETYLASFFSNTMKHGLIDAKAASTEIQQDYIRLVMFFNGPLCEKHHGIAGLYTSAVLNERLSLLQNLSRVLDPDLDTDTLEEDIQALMVHLDCGDSGAPVVLHIAGLRKLHNSQESTLWVKAITQANKNLQEIAYDGVKREAPYKYSIPDLRNSKQLQNIRPRRRDLDRGISMRSRPLADSTTQYLQNQSFPTFSVREYANRASKALNQQCHTIMERMEYAAHES